MEGLNEVEHTNANVLCPVLCSNTRAYTDCMLASLGECLSSVMQGAMYIVAFHKTNGNC